MDTNYIFNFFFINFFKENIPFHLKISKTTSKGIPFQLSLLPDNVLKSIEQFYICEVCCELKIQK